MSSNTSKGDQIHPNVSRKKSRLESAIKQLFSSAEFSFEFVNASILLGLARIRPKESYKINISESPISSTGEIGFICLVELYEFYKFITDEHRKLQKQIFEANVRDYQGATSVNDEIKTALEENWPENFWWLNNGITILCSNATHSSKILTIEEPEIVNGLQTSIEIFNYFKTKTSPENDRRNILIRVIKPEKEESRDRVIKATNSQTQIPTASLRATEKIHRDIEEYFKPHGLFYDRRKNYYKNEGKSIAKIVSIPFLAQSVMSVLLQKPNDARARPSSLLKKDEVYYEIFNENYPINIYLSCINIMNSIEKFLKSDRANFDKKHRNNIRFYMAMYLSIILTNKLTPEPADLTKISLKSLDPFAYENALEQVYSAYTSLGGNDQTAKGAALKEEVKVIAKDSITK